jgi:hypothetical protein
MGEWRKPPEPVRSHGQTQYKLLLRALPVTRDHSIPEIGRITTETIAK